MQVVSQTVEDLKAVVEQSQSSGSGGSQEAVDAPAWNGVTDTDLQDTEPIKYLFSWPLTIPSSDILIVNSIADIYTARYPHVARTSPRPYRRM